MGKQIILCVEASKQAETDAIYIKDTINRFYDIDRTIKLSFVYMNGKTNYDSKSVQNTINKFSRDYKNGKSIVIYYVDLDKYESNPAQAKENNAIKEYVAKNKYEMVWFCHDIEEVYLGESIDKKQKKNTAIEFRKKEKIVEVDAQRLMAKRRSKGNSNILLVMDKYLKRK
ncbi:MAG: hypothetical protein IK014_11405 [Lachnospiraceae bacterium]|nr:hypothetical protein [Lachnospiraceae bacterium]